LGRKGSGIKGLGSREKKNKRDTFKHNLGEPTFHHKLQGSQTTGEAKTGGKARIGRRGLKPAPRGPGKKADIVLDID